MEIQVGLVHEKNFTVRFEDTARASGGADYPEVFSTPRMIGEMEHCAHEAIAPFLEAGWGSVGLRVNITHLAATPVGMTVRVRAEVIAVDGRRLVFKVEAWDEAEKIGEGEHERFIINREKFAGRMAQKAHPQQ
jgi:fluoroacetyl-CoA thioesterase